MNNPNAKILVVDDVAENRDLLLRRLTRLGFAHIDQAANGVEALAAIAAQNYDLVLLDIMMPVLDGFGVLEALRRDGRINELPILVISALSEMDPVVRCIELGAADFIVKPFNPTLLRARVLSTLEKKALSDLTRDELRRKQLELNEARTLQLALAPPPFAGTIAGRSLSIDVLLEPAKEVGGDVVDHFRVGDDMIVLALGDVSDKGAGAALMMARTHAMMRALTARPDAAELFRAPGTRRQRTHHGVRPRHHQRSTGALVGHVAERQHNHVVADAKMVDHIAANFLGGLEQDVDRQGAAGNRAGKWRRRESKLQRARLVEFQLLAPQFIAREVAQRLLFQRGEHTCAQQCRIKRLDDEVGGTELDAAHDRVHLAQRRNDQNRQFVDAAVAPERLQDAEAVQHRHHDIEQHEVIVLGGDRRQSLDAIRGLIDVRKAEARQPSQKQIAILRDVVNDKYFGFRVVHAVDSTGNNVCLLLPAARPGLSRIAHRHASHGR